MTTPDFEALLKVLKKDRRRSNPDLYRIGFKNFPPGNRAKSGSAECTVAPYCNANAAI